MVARRAGDGQHIVERHRDVGEDDLHERLAEALAFRFLLAGRRIGDVPSCLLQLAIHLPGDPEQQHAAGEGEADDGEELDGDERKTDAQRRRHGDAEGDDAELLLVRQAGRRHADDNRVVASEHDIDDDDGEQRDERLIVEQVGEAHRANEVAVGGGEVKMSGAVFLLHMVSGISYTRYLIAGPSGWADPPWTNRRVCRDPNDCRSAQTRRQAARYEHQLP